MIAEATGHPNAMTRNERATLERICRLGLSVRDTIDQMKAETGRSISNSTVYEWHAAMGVKRPDTEFTHVFVEPPDEVELRRRIALERLSAIRLPVLNARVSARDLRGRAATRWIVRLVARGKHRALLAG